MELHGDYFTTRQIDRQAIDDLFKLYCQCADFLALCPDPIPSIHMIERDLITTSVNGGIYSGIFLTDGRLAGVLDVIPSGYEGAADAAYLELLMLGAPFRSQGLGGQVFRALENWLAARGIRRLFAGVQVNNPGAVRFWQRMGFQVTSEPKLLDDGTVCVDLEKVLAPG